jgi:hypothetical protein
LKNLISATVGLLILSAPALAQAPAQNAPGNNAINTSNQNNSNAPVAGANSFTEGQAKSRIEASGYTGVSSLRKNNDGVWRGTAQKGGNSVNVSVDFQGNVLSN